METSFLFYLSMSLFICCIIYIYFTEKKIRLIDENIITYSINFPKDLLKDISHDENVWYYKDKFTCVGFGFEKEKCPKSQVVCSSKDKKYFGTFDEQLQHVKYAIDNGEIHDDCPLLYFSDI